VSTDGATPAFTYHHFGLIVTGEGERMAVDRLFRSLMDHGCCHFQVIRQVGQRSPLKSEKRILKMVNTGKTIPDKDVEEIGLPARRFLDGPAKHVILLDDLEADRVQQASQVFERYRKALDTVLIQPGLRSQASVHFLVNMLEAYYFADAATTNSVLGTQLIDWATDVELIPHPKNDLKRLFPGFDETRHGIEILKHLNVPHILANPSTCSSLRTLFIWCWISFGRPTEDRFCFQTGRLYDVTKDQCLSLP
jgi:hypothetical protein